MAKPELSDPLTLRLPIDVLADIEMIAATCERTRSWVMVRALRMYLAMEGEEILAIRRGREEIANGDVHDLADVLAELDDIIAGKAA